MPTAFPRIVLSDGSILTTKSGSHITAKPAKSYTGPEPPKDLKYAVDTGVLSWSPVPSATRYHVYASDPAADDPEAMTKIATVTALTYTASVLADSERRLYAVTAEDEHVLVESNLSKAVYGMGADRRL